MDSGSTLSALKLRPFCNTDGVLGQIKSGDFHGFPESVKNFQGDGHVTKITGGDGVVRDMLKIPGEYHEKQGFFEFIKEADGSINHRLFKPASVGCFMSIICSNQIDPILSKGISLEQFGTRNWALNR